MDWAGIWETIKNFFSENGWKIAGFFAVLILGFIIVKILIGIIRKILSKTKIDKITQKFLMSGIKLVLYTIYILVLLQTVGVAITGLIAALSAAVLAVGLALQGSLSNLANGIIIITGKMFKEGDYISVDGVEGTVKNINLLRTTIVTPDNKTISLPNSNIVNNPMTNYSGNKTRRVDFNFSVAYETDLDVAKKIVLDVINSDGRILLDPAPTCKLKTLDSSSIALFTTCWCDSEDYWDVYYYVMDKVFNEFKRKKISIPYNQVEVRLRKDNVKMPFDKQKLQKRVEKERKEEKKFDIFNLDIHSLNKKTKKRKEKKAKEVLENIAPPTSEEVTLKKTKTSDDKSKNSKSNSNIKKKSVKQNDITTNKKKKWYNLKKTKKLRFY